MANQKHIPYIPSMSIQFKRMQYIYCESETSSMVVTRADFMRLLEQQPCPMAQIYIDRRWRIRIPYPLLSGTGGRLHPDEP